MKLRDIGIALNDAGTFIWPIIPVSAPLIIIGFILIIVADIKISFDI